MNRRQFLKQIGAVCAAAVIAPVVLVGKKPKVQIRHIDLGRNHFLTNRRMNSFIYGQKSDTAKVGERAKQVYIGYCYTTSRPSGYIITQ